MSSLTFCDFILLALTLTKRFLLALLLALFAEIFEFSFWCQLVANSGSAGMSYAF
jgi:hypothetical protein